MIKLDSYLEKPIVKFILWFLTGLFIIFYGTLNVKAEEFGQDWGFEIQHFNRVQFYDCTSSSSCSTTINTLDGEGSISNTNYQNTFPVYQGLNATLVANSHGILVKADIRDNKFLTSHAYFFSIYVCNDTTTNLEPIQFYTGPNASIPTLDYPSTLYADPTYSKISDVPFSKIYFYGTGALEDNYVPEFGRCDVLSYYFKPNYSSNFFGARFTAGKTITSNISLIGYEYTDLGNVEGLSYSQVQNLIQQSDYQNSQNFEEVKSSVNEVKEGVEELNEQQEQTNNIITDDNVEGVDGAFEGFNSFLEDNGTITQLITLPITLYSAILNNINGTCKPFNLGNLFGANLSLPCINLGNYLGNTLWTMIDIIISGFAVYFIAKKLVKVFNNVSSMKEGDVIDD